MTTGRNGLITIGRVWSSGQVDGNPPWDAPVAQYWHGPCKTPAKRPSRSTSFGNFMASNQCDLDQGEPDEWARVVNDCFFPVETLPLATTLFSAKLRSWQFGDVLVATHSSDAVCYRRNMTHVRQDPCDRVLITFPTNATLRFSQGTSELTCKPGGFFLERSDLAYDFVQQTRGEMWSLMLPSTALSGRLRCVSSYASQTFDATDGAGGLLLGIIRSAVEHLAANAGTTNRSIGRIIVDLLLLAFEADPRILGSRLGPVQMGHMIRIEACIRRNLSDALLTPETIASACGISARYLHELFRSTGTTVSRWILDRRLEACHEDLGSGLRRDSVAQVAFRWGFSDHAHFSRHYKRRFGLTPRDRRAMAFAQSDRTVAAPLPI